MTNETLASMIDRVLSGDNSGALENFEDIISSKISDAIETKKIEIASTLGAKEDDAE